jgi:hypothetical protein
MRRNRFNRGYSVNRGYSAKINEEESMVKNYRQWDRELSELNGKVCDDPMGTLVVSMPLSGATVPGIIKPRELQLKLGRDFKMRISDSNEYNNRIHSGVDSEYSGWSWIKQAIYTDVTHDVAWEFVEVVKKKIEERSVIGNKIAEVLVSDQIPAAVLKRVLGENPPDLAKLLEQKAEQILKPWCDEIYHLLNLCERLEGVTFGTGRTVTFSPEIGQTVDINLNIRIEYHLSNKRLVIGNINADIREPEDDIRITGGQPHDHLVLAMYAPIIENGKNELINKLKELIKIVNR